MVGMLNVATQLPALVQQYKVGLSLLTFDRHTIHRT
jgi:hypothetical protein